MKAVLAEHKIELDCAKVGCTPSGIKFLQAALDPFSDIGVDCEGYPDKFSGKSVVQLIKTQYTVRGPNSTDNWDANIYFDRVLSLHNVVTTPNALLNTFRVNGQVAPPGNRTERGGVEVRRGVAGATLTDDDILAEASVATTIDSSYLSGGGVRCIGMAMEVINSTAPNFAQGNVIVYKDNDNGNQDTVCNVGSVTQSGEALSTQAFSLIEAPDIPETATEALNFYGSQKWEAKEGSYSVCTQKDDDIPFTYFESLGNLAAASARKQIPKGYVNTSVASTAPGTCRFSRIDGGITAGWYPNNSLNNVDSPMLEHHFLTSGAYYTGLSPTTTLDVVVHYLIERAPNESAKDLIVLTRRAAPYDPVALTLYGKVAGFLPVGVPRGENDLGDWIKEVADVLGNLGVPGMPIVKGIVSGFQAVSNGISNLSSSTKPAPGMNNQKKPAQQQQQKRNPPAKQNQTIGGRPVQVRKKRTRKPKATQKELKQIDQVINDLENLKIQRK